jgi:hypothetical protein
MGALAILGGICFLGYQRAGSLQIGCSGVLPFLALGRPASRRFRGIS